MTAHGIRLEERWRSTVPRAYGAHVLELRVLHPLSGVIVAVQRWRTEVELRARPEGAALLERGRMRREVQAAVDEETDRLILAAG